MGFSVTPVEAATAVDQVNMLSPLMMQGARLGSHVFMYRPSILTHTPPKNPCAATHTYTHTAINFAGKKKE